MKAEGGKRQAEGNRRRAEGGRRKLLGLACLSFVLAPFCPLLPALGRPPAAAPAQNGTTTRYYYRFANEKFLIQSLELEFDQTGRGLIRFQEQDQDPIENPITLTPATVAEFAAAFDRLNFLQSQEVYQTEKQFPHMGTATIRLRRGEEQREVSFNYTANKVMMDLWQRFRAVENQEYHLFKLDLAMRYQPLNTPHVLKTIESLLKNKSIAEPTRLVPALREIAENDQMMSIARSHAQRLIKSIESGKK